MFNYLFLRTRKVENGFSSDSKDFIIVSLSYFQLLILQDGWTALDKAKPNMGIKTLLKEHKGT